MSRTYRSATLIPGSDEPRWQAALADLATDVYHSVGYTQIAAATLDGTPYLLVVDARGGRAALPFVVRPVAQVPGLEHRSALDATSVEGYPGLVCSDVAPTRREGFAAEVAAAVRDAFAELGVVSFFGRQHPLLGPDWLLAACGDLRVLGDTVAVDCSLSDEAHQAQMSAHHRRNLRRLAGSGLHVEHPAPAARLAQFVDMYRATMDRLGAADSYRYPDHYFAGLVERLGPALTLAVACLDDEPVTAALLLHGTTMVHYHLGATAPRFRSLGAPHLLFDELRRWAGARGIRWLHLGGGVGAAHDSLFRFKSGFSRQRFAFRTLRITIDAAAVDELAGDRRRWLAGQGLAPASGFFPPYRASGVQPS